MNDTKQCSLCNRILPIDAFNKSAYRRCRDCQKIVRDARRADPIAKAKDAARAKIHKLENKEKYLKYQREYVKTHLTECVARRRVRYLNNALYHWAYDTVRGHQRRGYNVEITHHELMQFAQNETHCPICGEQYVWRGNGHKSMNKPSLDRLNNEKTINKDNIWIICSRCNATKGDRSMKEFVAFCKSVVNKFDEMDGRIRMDESKEVKA